VDPLVPVTSVRTLRAQADLNVNDERMAMIVGVSLGGAALLLAAVGLYGAMANIVGQRTREIGVRMALGANPADMRRLMLKQGVLLAVAGSGVGVALSLWCGRLIESRLYAVRAFDPISIGVSIALLSAVAIFASWAPARRAASVDPVVALRID
jgi:ABC-type antimicrobial peptide transport system permease subunit